MKHASNYLEKLLAERDRIDAQLKAIKELQITRVSNRNMFKREMMENRIKGK